MRSKNLLWLGLMIELFSILATLLSAWFLHKSSEEKARIAFERQVDRGMLAVTDRLSDYTRMLDSLAALIYSSKEVTLPEWRTFVKTLNIDEHYPGVSGFGLILRVEADAMDLFLAKAREEYGFDMEIKHLEDPKANQQYIICKVEPLERNRAALGLNVGSSVVRREACLKSMETGLTQITRSVVLVQDKQHKPGFLMLRPIYRSGQVPPTVEERRVDLLGWTYSPFVGERVMDGIDRMAGPGVRFALFDGASLDATVIYDGIGESAVVLESVRRAEVAGRNWCFRWIANDETDMALQSYSDAGWVLFFGILSSVGLVLVMWLLHTNNSRALRTTNETPKV